MWLFWLSTALLAAGAAALVIARAAAASREAADRREDPAFGVYRRQLAELDGEAGRGGLDPDALRAARTEAARRLLRFADGGGPAAERPGGRGSRLASLLVAAFAALLALGGYLLLGAPGLADQPYAKRLAGWKTADPASLEAPQLAAVLREIVARRPHDPQALDYLGRAELSAGDPAAAARAFGRAAALAPDRPALYADEGQALVIDAGGKPTPEAITAFRTALAGDPANAAARYFLGRADMQAGRRDQALAEWKALAASLPEADPHRPALLAEIAMAEGRGPSLGPAGATPAEAGGAMDSPAMTAPPGNGQALLNGPQGAFIQAMVARQVADLKTHPGDADGWARLVRAYGVLGETAARDRALGDARHSLAGRPDALAKVNAAANGAPAAAPSGPGG